ncbi:MAG TPA: nuclear transport factor 2 family protein [Acidimicrobiales bacterium]|nr:nuclear transport factor 2 family protein [Acidimicrobiales bacterium]
MVESPESMERLARQVRVALETADLDAFSELLDENVRWGPPGDSSPPCQNREQVLAWYERGKASGTTATVSAITVVGDQLLVSLAVRGAEDSRQRVGQATRWQLLSVRDGLVSEIVGFDRRDEAEAYLKTSK